MAFRQPYRSGLRALAEGLLRKAQTERHYSQIEQQLELQKGQIAADVAQNLTQNFQQGVMGMVQQPAAPDTTVGENIIKVIPGEIEQLRTSISSMRAAGASPQQIAAAEALLVQKQRILTMPLDRVPGEYERTISGFVVPPVPGQINAVPGTRPGQSQWSDINPMVAPPTVPGTGLTGSQAFTDAMAGGASADARLGIEGSIVNNLIPRLSFNADEPQSVADAYMAMESIDALSPNARDVLGPLAARVREAARDPNVQAIIDRRAKINEQDDLLQAGRLEAQDIEILRGREALAFSLATHNPRIQAEFRRLDDDTQVRIGRALDTGVYAGLTPDEQKHLAILLDIKPDGLAEWSQGQIARRDRMDVLGEERERLALQQDQINITIGGLNISEKLAEYPHRVWEMSNQRQVAAHAEWQAQREQGFAPMQDEQTMVDMVSGAIANNDVGLLSHYIFALENGTALGVQMAAMMNPEALGELRIALTAARRVEELGMKRLEDDDELRTLTHREATLRIQEMEQLSPLRVREAETRVTEGEALSPLRIDEATQRHGLLPLELDALRQTYTLNIAEAERDIRGLALDEAGTTLATLGEIARALPPEYWDNPPPYVTRSLEALGLDTNVFRSISTFEGWLREEPLRKEAWTQIDLMIQSPPATDADARMMMESVEALTHQLGLDPIRRAAMMSAVASIWQEKDALLRQRLTQIAGDAVLDGSDVARALNAFSSVSTSLRQQHETVERQRIVDAGCGRFIDMGILDRPMLQWTSDLDQEAGGTDAGKTCRVMQSDYVALGDRISNVNNIQEGLANVLMDNYVPGGSVAPSNPGAATPAPSGNIDWGSHGVTPQHVANFEEMNRIAVSNPEGATSLYQQMVAVYGEPTVQAILREMGWQ